MTGEDEETEQLLQSLLDESELQNLVTLAICQMPNWFISNNNIDEMLLDFV